MHVKRIWNAYETLLDVFPTMATKAPSHSTPDSDNKAQRRDMLMFYQVIFKTASSGQNDAELGLIGRETRAIST